MSVRPFLRWIGGKGKNIDLFLPHLPGNFHDLAYVEPFAGSGAMLFKKRPHLAFVADVNRNLIVTYHSIRDDVENLIAKLAEHDKMDSEMYYYKIRDEFNSFDHDSGNATDQAARFLYLNARCFNGLFRVNKKGFFNAPFARDLKGLKRICVPMLYRSVSRYLSSSNITIKTLSFQDTVVETKEWADGRKCFFFLDPPYYPLNKVARFTSYAGEWNDDDFNALRKSVEAIDARGDLFLLCNNAVPFIKELFSDFNQHEHLVSRHVSCKASERKPALEILVSNYKSKLTQRSLLKYVKKMPGCQEKN